MIYKGYIITPSRPTGGKAGKGYNRSATIQVREEIGGGDYLLKKQFRFPVGDAEKRQAAIDKAKAWIDKQAGWR